MFERSHLSKLRLQRPGALPSSLVLRATLALSLLSPVALAQTTPAPTTAPATPAQTVPAQTPASTAPKGTVTTLPGSSNAASALGIEVSSTVKGRLVSCPKGLKVNSGAICLYTQNTLPVLRSLLRGKFSGRIVSDWKTGAAEKTASLLVKAGTQNAYVLLAQLSATETLVVVDTVPQVASSGTTAARPATPDGIVKGERYVLDSDLRGLVNVASLGAGAYRLASVAGGQVLGVTSGKKSATLGTGSVELAQAPVSDGRNLLFPLDGLRALGCTVTPAQVGVTVACGSASANIRPIVF